VRVGCGRVNDGIHLIVTSWKCRGENLICRGQVQKRTRNDRAYQIKRTDYLNTLVGKKKLGCLGCLGEKEQPGRQRMAWLTGNLNTAGRCVEAALPLHILGG
jgi:hypothetical protein